jgi:hypothetical protein
MLAIKVSQVETPPRQAPPRYATAVMLEGLSEEEALRAAVETSRAPCPPATRSP